ncbi:ABC transporter substrate-binding protein [uncultured Methylobacterium sp.]|uniref:ABC transporter substrate-binding protein n=1 Tax=uncultured Methylobacterium sp. TaxID=157278 RepID=UPI0035C9B24F
MANERLKVGLSESDRTRPLAAGEVKISGIETEISLLGVQDLFNRQLTDATFDCCEFPVSSFLRTLERPERPYIAVPIFPSRHFRLSSVYVNTGKNIRKPSDLAGKRIGVPVFDMAAAVWLRGIFHDHYGLDRRSPIYVAGGLETARAGDEHPQAYPERFAHEQRNDRSLAALLADGEIDALYTARAPSSWPSENVGRLFADPMGEEMGYFQRTRIFPAMHLVAIKRSVVTRCPGLPTAVYEAFARAQDSARAKLADSAALSTMLPWQLENLLHAQEQLGQDFWPAGLRKNRHMIETAIGYMLADGLIRTKFQAEDVFADSDLLAT